MKDPLRWMSKATNTKRISTSLLESSQLNSTTSNHQPTTNSIEVEAGLKAVKTKRLSSNKLYS